MDIRIRSLLAVSSTAVLTAVGLAVINPTPASANSALECPQASQFCLFSHPGPRPKMIRSLPGNYPRNRCINVVDPGDPVDTFHNATGSVWLGYKKSDCSTGKPIEFQPGWQGGMLGTFGKSWADGRLHGVARRGKG